MSDEDLKAEFDRYDRDGNGAIDEDEFSELVRSLGATMSEDRIYIAFRAIDVNGNRRIEFGEFAAWWKKR